MNKLTNLLSVLALAALIACGGNDNKTPDAPPGIDAPKPDAPPSTPPPPTLGPQIDRMGRPAINTALNHTFDVNASTKGAAKDAYNQDEGQGNWSTMYAPDFVSSLAILDALDGTCGNQVLYDGSAAAGAAYGTAAGLLAADELYLNTNNGTCNIYLGVELDYLSIAGATDCGGRTPTEDVVDVSYSALAAGLGGFDMTTLAPKIGDGVSAHTDLGTTFPYLGAPH
jgi:hypothetical protein